MIVNKKIDGISLIFTIVMVVALGALALAVANYTRNIGKNTSQFDDVELAKRNARHAAMEAETWLKNQSEKPTSSSNSQQLIPQSNAPATMNDPLNNWWLNNGTPATPVNTSKLDSTSTLLAHTFTDAEHREILSHNIYLMPITSENPSFTVPLAASGDIWGDDQHVCTSPSHGTVQLQNVSLTSIGTAKYTVTTSASQNLAPGHSVTDSFSTCNIYETNGWSFTIYPPTTHSATVSKNNPTSATGSWIKGTISTQPKYGTFMTSVASTGQGATWYYQLNTSNATVISQTSNTLTDTIVVAQQGTSGTLDYYPAQTITITIKPIPAFTTATANPVYNVASATTQYTTASTPDFPNSPTATASLIVYTNGTKGIATLSGTTIGSTITYTLNTPTSSTTDTVVIKNNNDGSTLTLTIPINPIPTNNTATPSTAIAATLNNSTAATSFTSYFTNSTSTSFSAPAASKNGYGTVSINNSGSSSTWTYKLTTLPSSTLLAAGIVNDQFTITSNDNSTLIVNIIIYPASTTGSGTVTIDSSGTPTVPTGTVSTGLTPTSIGTPISGTNNNGKFTFSGSAGNYTWSYALNSPLPAGLANGILTDQIIIAGTYFSQTINITIIPSSTTSSGIVTILLVIPSSPTGAVSNGLIPPPIALGTYGTFTFTGSAGNYTWTYALNSPLPAGLANGILTDQIIISGPFNQTINITIYPFSTTGSGIVTINSSGTPTSPTGTVSAGLTPTSIGTPIAGTNNYGKFTFSGSAGNYTWTYALNSPKPFGLVSGALTDKITIAGTYFSQTINITIYPYSTIGSGTVTINSSGTPTSPTGAVSTGISPTTGTFAGTNNAGKFTITSSGWTYNLNTPVSNSITSSSTDTYVIHGGYFNQTITVTIVPPSATHNSVTISTPLVATVGSQGTYSINTTTDFPNFNSPPFTGGTSSPGGYISASVSGNTVTYSLTTVPTTSLPSSTEYVTINAHDGSTLKITIPINPAPTYNTATAPTISATSGATTSYTFTTPGTSTDFPNTTSTTFSITTNGSKGTAILNNNKITYTLGSSLVITSPTTDTVFIKSNDNSTLTLTININPTATSTTTTASLLATMNNTTSGTTSSTYFPNSTSTSITGISTGTYGTGNLTGSGMNKTWTYQVTSIPSVLPNTDTIVITANDGSTLTITINLNPQDIKPVQTGGGSSISNTSSSTATTTSSGSSTWTASTASTPTTATTTTGSTPSNPGAAKYIIVEGYYDSVRNIQNYEIVGYGSGTSDLNKVLYKIPIAVPVAILTFTPDVSPTVNLYRSGSTTPVQLQTCTNGNCTIMDPKPGDSLTITGASLISPINIQYSGNTTSKTCTASPCTVYPAGQ